jgi:DNA-directed RNA polymerase specialized sigma24 family protein
MEESDPALVARALRGDEYAFQLLTERHSQSVFHLAYRMTGNEQDAEDIVQETFLRAFRNLKRYESRSLFSTWLYRIAANYTVDLIRSRKRFVDPAAATSGGDWLNDVAHGRTFGDERSNSREHRTGDGAIDFTGAYSIRSQALPRAFDRGDWRDSWAGRKRD